MAHSEDLKSLVATILMLPPDSLSSETSLSSLDNSLKGARLTLGLKRLGYAPQFRRVPATFGELETSLNVERAPTAGNPDSPVVQRDLLHPSEGGASINIGLDIQDIHSLPACTDYWEHEFYIRCFHRQEIAYAVLQSEPTTHFAGFWSAKEALKKCDARFLKTDLTLLSVHHETEGKPYFLSHLPGKIFRLPHSLSISHTGSIASAMVALPKQ